MNKITSENNQKTLEAKQADSNINELSFKK